MKEKKSLLPFYEVDGIVIHGRGIGKLVGMPTANLKIPNDKELPESGVYISRIFLDGQTFYGATHIGARPTINDSTNLSFETHILNFKKNIYGHVMHIQLFSKIRIPQKFDELSFLLEQIQKDCIVVQKYWGIKQLCSDLSINRNTHQVMINSHEVYLSSKEFDVLYLLYSNPNIAFTKEQIYEMVWHEPANNAYHAVENTIFQIRKRLKPFSANHDTIKTIIGLGYKYNS